MLFLRTRDLCFTSLIQSTMKHFKSPTNRSFTKISTYLHYPLYHCWSCICSRCHSFKKRNCLKILNKGNLTLRVQAENLLEILRISCRLLSPRTEQSWHSVQAWPALCWGQRSWLWRQSMPSVTHGEQSCPTVSFRQLYHQSLY